MRPPNLLFIFTDEQRYDTLAAAGNDWLAMPSLNRLAGQSCHFEHAVCTQPVCTPSRSSLMTGLYPHATGATTNNIPLRPDVRCLPELLAPELRRQYATAYHGKWHLGDEIFAQHGFDEWISIEDHYAPHYGPGRDQGTRCSYFHWLRAQGFKPDLPDEFSRDRACTLPERYGKPAFLGNEATRFIHQHRDQPFMLYVNFLEPHMPFIGPWTQRYDPAAIPLPAAFNRWPGPDDCTSLRLKAARFAREGFEWYDLSSEAGWRQLAAAYYGNCTLIDHHTGRILQALEDSGVADRTIVVFTSDHGEMLGAHGVVGKSVMQQDAIRVPLLLRLPGQREPRRVSGPFSQVNLAPTLLELMGQAPPAELHGRSLAGRLGASTRLEDDVFIQWNAGPGRLHDPADQKPPAAWQVEIAGSAEAVHASAAQDSRTILTLDGWRLTVTTRLGDHELFDVAHDPQERCNLARRPEHRARMNQLLARIRAWQARVGDPVRLPEAL